MSDEVSRWEEDLGDAGQSAIDEGTRLTEDWFGSMDPTSDIGKDRIKAGAAGTAAYGLAGLGSYLSATNAGATALPTGVTTAGTTAATGAGWGTAAAAAIPAIGSIYSGKLQSDAISDASDAQSDAISESNRILEEQFNKSVEMTAPWRDAGANALSAYENSLGLGEPGSQEASYEQFRNTPGYQFQMEEMRRNTEGAQSAGGRSMVGGSTLKALQDRAQGIADQTYGIYQDRLSGLSTVGANISTGNATNAINYGNNVSTNAINQGQNDANAYINQSNVGSNVIKQLVQGYGQYQGGQNQYRPPSGSYGLNPNNNGYNAAIDAYNTNRVDMGGYGTQQRTDYENTLFA